MDAFEWPSDWVLESDLPVQIAGLIEASECGLVQVACNLAFTLASVLVGEPDAEFRVQLAEAVTEKLMEAARSGVLPGEMTQ